SIMPQKRNPDAAELVRAKTGRVIGALTALLIVMKGLPLAYQKDMQEDKQGAMEAFGALSLAIRAMTGMVQDIVPDQGRMKAAAAMAEPPLKTCWRKRKAGSGGWKKSKNKAETLTTIISLQFHHCPGLARAGQCLYGAGAFGISS